MLAGLRGDIGLLVCWSLVCWSAGCWGVDSLFSNSMLDVRCSMLDVILVSGLWSAGLWGDVLFALAEACCFGRDGQHYRV